LLIALGQVGDKSDVAKLLSSADKEKSYGAQSMIVEALGRMRTKAAAAIAKFEALRESEDQHLAYTAAAAPKKIK